MAGRAKWVLALALLPLVACSSSQSTTPAPLAPMQQPQVSAQDQNFAMTAAASDQFEIQSAQVALQKSRNPAVKRFAQHMIDDHTKTAQLLMAMAQAKGMPIQPTLNADEQTMLTGLQNAQARAFDGLYWRDAVTSHQAAVAAFQGEANDGYNADIKSFAQQNLPTVQQHLAMAQRQGGS